MKSYISSGRTEVKNLEAEAMASQPPLFHDYKNASAMERSIMDTQLRDLKTNARYQSKAGWHNWRAQLLNDLKTGLLQTQTELEQDDKLLAQVESAFQEVLPGLEDHQADLLSQLSRLEQRKQDVEDNSAADLDEAREQLMKTEAELSHKRELLHQLQGDLTKQASRLEDARSWKAETQAAIAEADRISEECRGWSNAEVLALQERLSTLQNKLGWKLMSATDDDAVTLKHDELSVTFHPRAWITRGNTPLADSPNAPIFVSYVGAEDMDGPKPEATVRRFFLQLLRAHAHALPQSSTRASRLLGLIANGWSLCSRVLDAVRSLELCGVSEVQIMGDAKLGLITSLLLPSLQTKVQVKFLMDVVVEAGECTLQGRVKVTAHVVYGEKYDEAKMSEFLQQFVASGVISSNEETRRWADGMEDLRNRLVRRGPKGTRV
jgi:kinetochore protein Spc7/SPC105